MSSGFVLKDAVVQPHQETNEMDFDSQRNRRMKRKIEVENENGGIPCGVPGSILIYTEEFS